MKAAFRTLLGLAVVFAVTLAVRAEDEKKKDEKEKTFKGELGCAKCSAKFFGFKKGDYAKCTNAIKATEGKTTKVYILDDKGKDEDYHVCTGQKKATVKGTLDKDKKKIKPTDVKVD
jgi:protein-arginine kinase activator protein McsA